MIVGYRCEYCSFFSDNKETCKAHEDNCYYGQLRYTRSFIKRLREKEQKEKKRKETTRGIEMKQKILKIICFFVRRTLGVF